MTTLFNHHNSITLELFLLIVEKMLRPDVSTDLEPHLLEFGSGPSTGLLSRFMRVTSIENDPVHGYRDVGLRFPVNVQHVPFVDGKFQLKPEHIPPAYTGLLIDGPIGVLGRSGVLSQLDLLGLNDAARRNIPIFVDDVQREHELKMAIELANMLSRACVTVGDGNHFAAYLLPADEVTDVVEASN